MDENKIEQEQEQSIEPKKAYTPPVLTTYGKLTELTAGGSVGNPETSGNTMSDMIRT
jgi:hypothetical protein